MHYELWRSCRPVYVKLADDKPQLLLVSEAMYCSFSGITFIIALDNDNLAGHISDLTLVSSKWFINKIWLVITFTGDTLCKNPTDEVLPVVRLTNAATEIMCTCAERPTYYYYYCFLFIIFYLFIHFFMYCL